MLTARKTAKSKPRINKRLFRRIRDHILEEPRRFFMSAWVVRDSGKPSLGYSFASTERPPCGTAACIGGWAVILAGEKATNSGRTQARARKLLGLTKAQACGVFGISMWPSDLRERHDFYDPAESDRKRAGRKARAAARVIDMILEGRLGETSSGTIYASLIWLTKAEAAKRK